MRYSIRSLMIATAAAALLAASTTVRVYPSRVADEGADVVIFLEPIVRLATMFRDGRNGRVYIQIGPGPGTMSRVY